MNHFPDAEFPKLSGDGEDDSKSVPKFYMSGGW